jgi:hypothetical protein
MVKQMAEDKFTQIGTSFDTFTTENLAKRRVIKTAQTQAPIAPRT